MSYRKLEVNGKQHEYVVGKTHTKVRGGKTYLNSSIGDQVGDTDSFVVTPYNVANAIKGISQKRHVIRCNHGTTTHEIVEDPFDAEIYGKSSLMINCKHCVENRRMDI